jgi:hypothetical protein
MSTAITNLRNAGANVIVDDLGPVDEPMYLDGFGSQAIESAAASGVTYFAAAGNGGRLAYEQSFRNSGGQLTIGTTPVGFLHDFDPGPGFDVQQRITLPIGSSGTIAFQWDQPWFSVNGVGSASDMDIYLLEPSTLSIAAQSVRVNINGDPWEAIAFFNGTGFTQFDVLLVLRSGPAPTLMKYACRQSVFTINEFNTSSGTLFGHQNSQSGAAVASAGFYNTPAFGVNPPLVQAGGAPRFYSSSVGGTSILFNSAGTRLASPILRNQPRFTAPDDGNTTFFGSDIANDGDAFPNFAGTSAAAPHAAGVAALMKQLTPLATPSQILNAMSLGTIDMDDAFLGGFQNGFDFNTGTGLLQADQDLTAVLPDITPFQPAGWSNKIVISTVAGTNTDAATVNSTQQIFVDAALINQGGSAAAQTFFNRLRLDGVDVAFLDADPPFPATATGTIIDLTLGPLSPGNHQLTFLCDFNGKILEGQEGNNSFTRNFTVVPPPPIVIQNQFLRETAPQQVTFRFDQNVSASLTASDFTGLGTPNVDYTVSYFAPSNTATLTLTNILANGNYTVTAVASGIFNASGVPLAADKQFKFQFQRGDADGDGDVDVNDLGILASNWQQSPRTFSQGNFDYSANLLVDVNDLGILATFWQTALPPLSPSVAPFKSPFFGPAKARGSVMDLVDLSAPAL